MATDTEKLAYVLAELKRVELPGSEDDGCNSPYWEAIEVRVDNATGEFVDNDLFHKNLIKFIEE